MTKKPATIRDVAQASGVSTATVSYVLNNGPRRVDVTTKERVLATIQRLQYYPSTMARGLNQKRLDCLGVVFPQPIPRLVVDSYFGAILDGIINVATERQQNVTLYTSMAWHGSASLPAFRDRRVDGLLLIATLTDSNIVPTLAEAGIPFVLINDTVTYPGVTSIDIDNADAANQVIEHLAALGHQRIGFVGGQPNSPSSKPRLEGFRQAMENKGLLVDPDLVIEGTYTQQWGNEGMKQLLGLPDPPTAVFAGGDGIALGIYQACAEAGISIPAQMSVIGFDNAPFTGQLNPPMTTVHHPLMEIGAMAATLLLDRLDDASRSARQVILPVQLIVRESTATPRTLSS